MNDIIKLDLALEDSNILLKGITKTIKNITKERKGEFLGMLLGTFGASLLGNMVIRKGMLRAGYGNKGKKRKVNSWLGIFNQRKLILPHPLPNFEIQKYYQNEPRLNGLYSRYNLPKRIMDGGISNKS